MALYKSIVNKIPVASEKKIKQKEYQNTGLYPIIDQGTKLIGGYTNDKNKVIVCDHPVIIFGDHTKCVKYIDFEFAAGADGIKVLSPKSNVLPKFLFYGTLYLTFKIVDKGYARHYQYLEKNDFPLPDLQEQDRIVSRIEELFSELDKAVETLQTTKKQLTVYRQAVLKEVFSGFAETDSIENLTTMVTSGSRGWAQYYSNSGALFIRIGNLTNNNIEIIFDDVQYVDLPEKAEGKRSLLNENDVLISITADLGSIGLVPKGIGEAYINQHIALVRFKNPLQGKFMAWFLRSDYGQKNLLKNKRGIGKPGLGLDDIRGAKVPVVSDLTANKIVLEIESRLSVCDNIEKTVDAALSQAEAMRQSILKKAFEGGSL